MRDPKALVLFQEILKKTEAGKLSWQPTAEPDKFIAPMLGKYMLTLLPYTSRSQWGEPQGPPSVIVSDEKENTIVEIDADIEGISQEELTTLQVFARRIALHADEKINELLQELQKPDFIIREATYGAQGRWVDVTHRLIARIREDKLSLTVTNEELGGDPFPGVLKSLQLAYSYSGENYSVSVQEGELLSIP